MNLTNWYSGDQKPVRPGVYERLYEGGPLFCFWTGTAWCGGQFEAREADTWRHEAMDQELPWRGITK